MNDRLLYRFWKDYDQPLTLAGDGETFTFMDRAFVRIRGGQVEVSGGLRALKLKVDGAPKLVVNGQEQPARTAGGWLILGAAP